MRPIRFFPPYFVLVILLLNCSALNENIVFSDESRSMHDDYFVDYRSIEEIAGYHDYLTKGSMTSKSPTITPFVFQDETVYYIVNYPENRGWQVFSSDRRTPAILAEGYSGQFSLDTTNEGAVYWMMCVAQDMYKVRHTETSSLSFTSEEIEANIHFWTKEPMRSQIPDEEDEGHWWGSTTTITEPYDSIPHLTITQWDQGGPYNQYCPLKTDGTSHRAPAGCTAIAGAQMLYYLHEKWGIPQSMASSASCVGNIDNYTMSQWNFTTTVWDEMATDYYLIALWNQDDFPESVMIAHIGQLVGTEYGNNSSAASIADLVENVFNHFGIDCDYGSFSENTVKSNLLSGFPIIASACRQWYPNWNLSIPGHSFLIDGYKRTRVKTTTHYTFIPDDPEHYDPSSHPDYDNVTYSSPVISYIKMNWGINTQWYINGAPYNTSILNDGWYTLTGDWVVEDGGNQYNYQYYRKMLSDFSIME